MSYIGNPFPYMGYTYLNDFVHLRKLVRGVVHFLRMGFPICTIRADFRFLICTGDIFKPNHPSLFARCANWKNRTQKWITPKMGRYILLLLDAVSLYVNAVSLFSDTPFGHLPCLEVDGQRIYQSNAIHRFLAKRFSK